MGKGPSKQEKAAYEQLTALSKQQGTKAGEELALEREKYAKAGELEKPITDYYKSLIEGDRDVLTRTYGPALSDLTAQYQQAIKGVDTAMPIGGEAGLAKELLEGSAFGARTSLLAGAPAAGIAGYTDIYSRLLGAGGALGGLSTGSAGAAGGFMNPILQSEGQRRQANMALMGQIAGIGGAIGGAAWGPLKGWLGNIFGNKGTL